MADFLHDCARPPIALVARGVFNVPRMNVSSSTPFPPERIDPVRRRHAGLPRRHRSAFLAAAALCASFSYGSARAGFACGEGFADVSHLFDVGWSWSNNSVPLGDTDWYQGNPVIFPAWAGGPDSYVAADSNNAGAGNPSVVSNWLITPDIDFGPNDFNIRVFDFYTRAVPGAANRLIVRLCMQSDIEPCDAPGPAPDDLGGFVTTLLAINPDLTLAGYPDQWTEYTLTPADGLPVVGRGRIAFHYSVPLQLDDTHGTYIGIDAVTMSGATTCPFTDVLLANGFD